MLEPETLKMINTVVIGYLLGGINFSIIMGKLTAGIDIRQFGSGNAGTTNTLRVLGKKAAVVTLVGDMLKGTLAAYIGYLFCGEWGAMVGGGMALFGHCFPVYYNFKGGKGVATCGGMLLIVDWRIFLIMLGILVLTLVVTRYMSLGSMLACVAFPFLVVFFKGYSVYYLAWSIFMSLLVIYQHRSNIARLIRGEESKFSLKKKSE